MHKQHRVEVAKRQEDKGLRKKGGGGEEAEENM